MTRSGDSNTASRTTSNGSAHGQRDERHHAAWREHAARNPVLALSIAALITGCGGGGTQDVDSPSDPGAIASHAARNPSPGGIAGSVGPVVSNGVPAPTSGTIYGRPRPANPMTGQYQWFGQVYPDSYGAVDRARGTWTGGMPVDISYERHQWKHVQPRRPTATDDGFDWAVIDQRIAEAAAKGQRYAFRVMPVSSPVDALPAWLAADSNAWTYYGPGYSLRVPDWNSTAYMNAATNLIRKLGERYDGDDRVAFVDAMGYGDWGEWHVSTWDGATPSWLAQHITADNAITLARTNHTAFNRTRVLQLSAEPHALAESLSRPEVGLRVDCLGDATAGYALVFLTDAGATNKWKTAPVVTEWCQHPITTQGSAWYIQNTPQYAFMVPDLFGDLFTVGARQVRRWHVSAVSGGNFDCASWDACLSDSQAADLHRASDLAGYRYHVRLASMPQWATAGTTVPVVVEWRNYGGAPTYENWNPRLQLRDVNGRVVADLPAGIDLKQLYSANDSGADAFAPVSVRSVAVSLKLPTTLARGTYTLVAVVKRTTPLKPGATTRMPDGWYARAMALEGEGTRGADRSQPIGTLTIR